MQIESKQQILERRKEIEQELVEMLKETDPPSPRLRTGEEENNNISKISNLIIL